MEKIKLQIESNQYSYLYKWNVKSPIAVMHLIHGSKEHIGRYIPMITYLNQQGIAVYGMDLRGHGESAKEQGILGHIDSYKRVANDLDAVNREIAKDHPGVNMVMYGHSMGSFILRYYLMTHKSYDAIISGTNEQDVITTHVGLLIARMTKLFKGKGKINKLIDQQSYKAFNKKMKPGESWMSNDPTVWEKYSNDPINPKGFTNESFIAMLSWLREIRKHKAYRNHKGRVLIISGSNDPVGNMGKGPKKVSAKFKKQGASVLLRIYQGGHHEIHNDKNRMTVYKEIVEFIKDAQLK